MKHAIVAVLTIIVLMLVPVGLIATSNQTPAFSAPAVVSCTDVKVGPVIHIKCSAAGVIVLDQTVPLPTVTVPGDPITIKVPLPQETVTIHQPGPTSTVTAHATATQTAAANSAPAATVTITNPAQPGETVTVTSAPQTTRQGATTPATMETPTGDDTVIRISTKEAVGIGTLFLLGAAGLILLGMYAGYYLGYKDSDEAEAKFLKALLGR